MIPKTEYSSFNLTNMHGIHIFFFIFANYLQPYYDKIILPLLNSKQIMYIKCIFMCVPVPMFTYRGSVHVSMCRDQLLFLMWCSLVFWDMSHCPGIHQVSLAGWPVNPRIHLSLPLKHCDYTGEPWCQDVYQSPVIILARQALQYLSYFHSSIKRFSFIRIHNTSFHYDIFK